MRAKDRTVHDHGGERAASVSDEATETDPERALDVLGDADARALFRHADGSTTVPELASAAGIPRSTAYRKVERLVDAGVLERTAPVTPAGSPPATYRRAVSAVTVDLGDGLTVTVRGGADAPA